MGLASSPTSFVSGLIIYKSIMATPLQLDCRVTLIGAGTIGLSLAALHLQFIQPQNLTIVDPRPDLKEVVNDVLPRFLGPSTAVDISSIRLTSDLPNAVANSDVIQENGPESVDFKSSLWVEVEKHAPSNAFLWTSTTGIPASVQNQNMKDKTRLIVVHPFNPPHILPLFEIVPSPETSSDVVEATIKFWQLRERKPVLVQKEITGVVAGRLAWALLREAINLVDKGVVTVEDVDTILKNSMGPRWAYAGIFESFHAGGGPRGLEGLLENVGRTVQAVWDDLGTVNMDDPWREKIFKQTGETYPQIDLSARDRANARILQISREERER